MYPIFSRGRGEGVNGNGRAWPAYGTYFNYGARGHYAPECFHLVRERGVMYPIFGRGRGQEKGVNSSQNAKVTPLDAHAMQEKVMKVMLLVFLLIILIYLM